MAPRAGPISGPFRNCGRRIFSQAFHARRDRRHIRNATENTADEILGTLQNAKCARESRTPNFVTSAKGACLSLFSSLSLSSWPLESVRWIEAKDPHPSDSQACRQMVGPCLGVRHGHWSRAGACEDRYRERPYRFASYRLRQAPPGVLAFGLPCGFGVPTVAAFTPCTPAVWPHRLYRQMHVTRFTVGIIRPLRKSADLGLDTRPANQRLSEHGRRNVNYANANMTQFD